MPGFLPGTAHRSVHDFNRCKIFARPHSYSPRILYMTHTTSLYSNDLLASRQTCSHIMIHQLNHQNTSLLHSCPTHSVQLRDELSETPDVSVWPWKGALDGKDLARLVILSSSFPCSFSLPHCGIASCAAEGNSVEGRL